LFREINIGVKLEI